MVRRLGGNFDLVKINLRNEEVINHIFECIKLWIDEFDIDGLRLDVAYCLDKDFLKRLRSYTDSLKNDFLLLGELLHGDSINLSMTICSTVALIMNVTRVFIQVSTYEYV